jgi:hypothetical protein
MRSQKPQFFSSTEFGYLTAEAPFDVAQDRLPALRPKDFDTTKIE